MHTLRWSVGVSGGSGRLDPAAPGPLEHLDGEWLCGKSDACRSHLGCAEREGHNGEPAAGLAAWQGHAHGGAEGKRQATSDTGLPSTPQLASCHHHPTCAGGP